MPALLTMMSRRPNVETAASTRLLQVGDLADVGLHADDLVAEGPHLLLDLVLGLLVGDVVDDDVGALPGQGQHHRLADAGVAAGHDGHFSLQSHGAPVWAEMVPGAPVPHRIAPPSRPPPRILRRSAGDRRWPGRRDRSTAPVRRWHHRRRDPTLDDRRHGPAAAGPRARRAGRPARPAAASPTGPGHRAVRRPGRDHRVPAAGRPGRRPIHGRFVEALGGSVTPEAVLAVAPVT